MLDVEKWPYIIKTQMQSEKENQYDIHTACVTDSPAYVGL